jgi:glyoxylase I family protein
MFSIEGLDHVVLRSTDPLSLIAFYRDVLGCAVEREVVQVGLTQLRAGASLIDIIRAEPDDKPVDVPDDFSNKSAGRNLDHFCLRINPFDSTELAAHFANHAVPIREVPRVYGAQGYGQAIYLEDPDGNTVELKGPTTPDHPRQ